MKKTFIIALWSIVCISSVFSQTKDKDIDVDGIRYTILTDEEGNRTLGVTSGYPFNTPLLKYKGDVVIPETVVYNGNTYHVVRIKRMAFSDCIELTSVSMPNSVTVIERQTFSGSSKLKSVVLSENLDSIGSQAFYECRALTSMVIPDKVTFLGERSINGCWGLENLVIGKGIEEIRTETFSSARTLEKLVVPGTVKTIGEAAFTACTKLKDLTLSEGIDTVKDGVFAMCRGLEEVSLPKSLRYIGVNPFYECSQLKAVRVDAENERFTAVDGVLFSKDGRELITFPEAKASDYTIPENCETIKCMAFDYNPILERIVVSDKVKKIEIMAFSRCLKLETVKLGAGLDTIGAAAFEFSIKINRVYSYNLVPPKGVSQSGLVTTGTLYVPKAALDAYKAADGWKDFATIQAMEDVVVEKPTDLAVSNITATSVKLNWSGSADKYRMRVEKKEGENWVAMELPQEETIAQSYDLLKLAPETTYRFSVKALVGEFESDYAEPVVFTTLEEAANESTCRLAVNVYPNPSRGKFTLELEESARVEVFALSGACVKTMALSAGKNVVSLVNGGVYFIKITSASTGASVVRRVIVNR